MRTLNHILQVLYKNYAVVFPPVKTEEAQRASIALVKAGLPAIPRDYVRFTEATNGLFWNGLELFGLSEQKRGQGAFVHTGISQTYAGFATNPLLRKKLVLGWAPEELIVYAPVEREYQIIDRFRYEIVLRFPRFLDVLYFYTRDLLETPAAPENQPLPKTQ